MPALRKPTHLDSMNTSLNTPQPNEPASLPCAFETLRETVRIQHPEWVDPQGECAPCFEFEQSLRDLTYTEPAQQPN